MPQRLLLTGLGGIPLRRELEHDLVAVAPLVVGVTSAYVTVGGVEALREILVRAGVTRCRMVAGLDDEITQPAALRLTCDWGWGVRVVHGLEGRFHPKFIVAGRRFARNGDIGHVRFMYLGSANITHAALSRNTEAGVILTGSAAPSRVDTLFGPVWRVGTPLTRRRLQRYEWRFAKRNRGRSPETLAALGVTESTGIEDVSAARLRVTPRPRRHSYSDRAAIGVWVGLQSFTGGYRFQIELPRRIGEIVRRLAGRIPAGGVDVLCDDGEVRGMKYQFYQNQMYRLNVPEGISNVEWSRENHDGVAVIERETDAAPPLRLRILRPGQEANQVMAKSYALGTWDRTPTRLYGWY